MFRDDYAASRRVWETICPASGVRELDLCGAHLSSHLHLIKDRHPPTLVKHFPCNDGQQDIAGRTSECHGGFWIVMRRVMRPRKIYGDQVGLLPHFKRADFGFEAKRPRAFK